MSGIVTILFCGIAMALFVRPNISPHARDLTKNVPDAADPNATHSLCGIGFQDTSAYLRDLCLCVLGARTVYAQSSMGHRDPLCVRHCEPFNPESALLRELPQVICLFARLCNIYPLTFVLNKFIKTKIGPRKQFTMWFSGKELPRELAHPIMNTKAVHPYGSWVVAHCSRR